MIIGHEKQIKFFKKIREKESVSHAFIFSGEEKIGKKLLALEVSMFLNCLSKEEKPCNSCSNCLEIKSGIYKDVYLLEEEKEIKISDIKKLISALSFKTNLSNFKIGIIDNAHLMNEEAQNCFLKTLEEPKDRTIFFLVTKYPDLLLKTILSRSSIIKFKTIENIKIEEFLKKSNIKEERLQKILKISSGRPGVAIDLLNNCKEDEEEAFFLEIEKVISSDITDKFAYIKKITEDNQLDYFFDKLTNYFRNIIFSSFSSFERLKEIKENLELLIETRIKIERTNANSKLLIENLLINIK